MRTLLLQTIGSTNDEARRLGDAGESGPLWIRALEQSSGRGRRGNVWLGEPGNLFCTCLLSLEKTPMEAANLSFVAALAVADTVAHFVGAPKVSLKWPNDVLIEGRKTCGILLESWAKEPWLQIAVGIGINVVTTPLEVDRPITCLQDHRLPVGNACEAATVFDCLRENFHFWLDLWLDQGFDPVRSAWLSKASGLGQEITARMPNETRFGVFNGLSKDGALELLDASGQTHLITAGDVFFG